MTLIFLIFLSIFAIQSFAIKSGIIEKDSTDIAMCPNLGGYRECTFTISFGQPHFLIPPNIVLSLVGLTAIGSVQDIFFEPLSVDISGFSLHVLIYDPVEVKKFRISYLAIEPSKICINFVT